MKISRKKFKIIISILIIIALAPVIVMSKDQIEMQMSINKTEKILNQIYAKDFETKVINKLKETAININTETIKTTFGKHQDVDNKIFKACSYGEQSDKYYKDFVYAFIIENNSKGIAIPLFKIESDNNGKFKTIEYFSGYGWFSENPIGDKIEDVVCSEYNIDYFWGFGKYGKTFLGLSHKPKKLGREMSLMYKDKDFATDIITEIRKNENSYYGNIDTEDEKRFVSKSILQEKERSIIWGLLDK